MFVLCKLKLNETNYFVNVNIFSFSVTKLKVDLNLQRLLKMKTENINCIQVLIFSRHKSIKGLKIVTDYIQ